MSNNGTAAVLAANMNTVGLGYGIAIAVGILVLVSTIMLASYLCVRLHGRDQTGATLPGNDAAVVPQTGDGDQSNGGEWSIAGLDQATLESYPKIVYSEKQCLPHPQDTSCSICLADYKDSEVLRMLPDCGHVFHVPCIDAWLRLHASCPMCRTSPLPTPQSTPITTPLSELIPLARHHLQNGNNVSIS